MTVHTARTFEPGHYKVLDYLDNKQPPYCGGPLNEYTDGVKRWEADMARAIGPDWRRKAYRCIHCGNGLIRWIITVLHRPTGDIGVFGADCAYRLGLTDHHHQVKLAMLKTRAMADTDRLKAWQDILRMLDRYGSLSDTHMTMLEQFLAQTFTTPRKTS